MTTYTRWNNTHPYCSLCNEQTAKIFMMVEPELGENHYICDNCVVTVVRFYKGSKLEHDTENMFSFSAEGGTK